MFVSTKTAALTEPVSRRVTCATALQRGSPAREVVAHHAFVLPGFVHGLFQQFADEAGQAHVPAGGMLPGPGGDLLVQGDRDVSHARKITQRQCNYQMSVL